MNEPIDLEYWRARCEDAKVAHHDAQVAVPWPVLRALLDRVSVRDLDIRTEGLPAERLDTSALEAATGDAPDTGKGES